MKEGQEGGAEEEEVLSPRREGTLGQEVLELEGPVLEVAEVAGQVQVQVQGEGAGAEVEELGEQEQE